MPPVGAGREGEKLNWPAGGEGADDEPESEVTVEDIAAKETHQLVSTGR